MCDAHPAADHPVVSAPVRRRRLRIDEIDPQWHCTIVGTCLSLAELKSLTAKLGIQQKLGPAGYALHSAMVYRASRDKMVGKALSKLLDRKHALAVSRSAKIDNDAQLASLWAEALGKGEVAGACWAVMSHPQASAELRSAIFQEVHMLSHQVGAAARTDLRHIHGLEKEKAELEARLCRQQDQTREQILRRDRQIQTLQGDLDAAAAEHRRLSQAVTAAEEMDRLRRLTAELQTRLEAESKQRRHAEEERREAVGALAQLDEQVQRLAVENDALAKENQVYEMRLASALGGGDCLGDCDNSCGRLDLCGRCILFVGGRNHHLPHLRRLVEGCNGIFSHHDGGVESSLSRLHGLLGRADAVLFPVDCISHSAQDAVKQMCRRWQKPFIPVRRSGLGGYLSALAAVADTAS